MKHYLIITHGCQMNEHDSERIGKILENLGYQKTDQVREADLIFFNTCLVRENAEQKVLGQLGSLKKWREEDPDRLLAVSGCMMQTGPAKELIQKSYPQVDLVFGTQNINKLPFLLEEVRGKKRRVFDTGFFGGKEEEDRDFDRDRAYSAYVNIMTGCNNFCSYCIVPYARGREQSRQPEEIYREVQNLASRGYREVILLGQNVNSYGREMDLDFPDLLKRVCQIDGIQRVRFMSSHPKDLSDRLIAVMAEEEKVERHFHLPLQSGSDKVLKEMNRHYTAKQYLRLVEKLREAIPSITLTTDLIVGFPGETEEDHQATLDLCREVAFDNAFTFIYSKRPGTRAGDREDQVEKEVQSRRFQELTDLLYPIFYQKNLAMRGKEVEVLFEGPSKNDPARMSGRDSGYHLIHVPSKVDLTGQMRRVMIEDSNSFALMGNLVS